MYSQLDDGDSRLIPNPEPWINRFAEGGLKSVEERHGVPHSVKGEGSSNMVQENPDAGAVRSVDLNLVLAMAGRVTGVRAEEAPGFTVVTDAGVVTVACPLDAFVGNSYGCPLPTPVYLPVKSISSKGLFAQNLRQGVEPVGVIAVGLRVSLEGGLPVSTRQVELSVGRIWIQSELAGICRGTEDRVNIHPAGGRIYC